MMLSVFPWAYWSVIYHLGTNVSSHLLFVLRSSDFSYLLFGFLLVCWDWLLPSEAAGPILFCKLANMVDTYRGFQQQQYLRSAEAEIRGRVSVSGSGLFCDDVTNSPYISVALMP